MKAIMLLKIALQSLQANKMRSLLTMLGVVIGVAAVIAMVGIGDGAKARVSQRIKKLGTNLLIVRPGLRRFRHTRSGSVQTLTRDDARAIGRLLPGVRRVSPEVSRNLQVKYLNQNTNTVVLGATSTFPEVNHFQIGTGRFFTPHEERTSRKLCVIGATVAQQLFPGEIPLGKDLKIQGMNFQIIGVLAAKGQSGYRDPDDQIVIPLRVAQNRLFGVKHLRSIHVEVVSSAMMYPVQEQVERLLRLRHRIRPGAEDDFNIRNQKEIMETMSEVTGTFTILLASIALVSMIVGGIGIMNIMLVSVTERTREIGIRKAVGAKYRDVLLQFLVESIMLSIIGGLLGVGAGIVSAKVISLFGSWQTAISLKAIALSFSFAVMVGVFFGIYPARRAARLNPIEALRYE